MARFIDADALRERLEIINVVAEDWYGMGVSTGLYKAEKEICEMPAADVVPRADFADQKAMGDMCAEVIARQDKEIERLRDEANRYKRYYFRHDYDEMIAEAKAEAAKEIFEAIEREITDALKSNYKVLPQVEESEALWNNVNGKINALRGIEYFLEELKQKYTEDTP